MHFDRRTMVAVLLAVTLANAAGCSMFKKLKHNLQPHRLNQLNRGEAMASPEAYYSVSDPIPVDATSRSAPISMSSPATASPKATGASTDPSAAK